MLPPKDNPPKKPSAADWRQRRGTSISLGSIGQSALRPNADGRPPLLAPRPAAPVRPAAAKAAPVAAPQRPAAPQAPTGPSPGVSRAFMSGSLVPPRPLGPRPAAPQTPQAPTPDQTAARAAPQPLPRPQAAPPVRPAQTAPKPAADPSPKSMARPAFSLEGIDARPARPEPTPLPEPTPKAEPEVMAAAAPRRPAKTVRQFNAAVAADARGPAAAKGPGLFTRRNGLIAAVAVVAVAGVSTAVWVIQRPAATPSFTATAVTTPPPGPAAAVAVAPPAPPEPTASTSAVTEAPSDAPTIIAERASGPPANFGALAPKGVRPAAPAARGVGVELAPLPDAPDLGARSAPEPAAEPAPAPTPPPVIRLPSADEPFSTNTPNPDPGG